MKQCGVSVFLGVMLVFASVALCRADFDFVVQSVGSGGPYYHFTDADEPATQVEYAIELSGTEPPAAQVLQVKIALFNSGNVRIASSEVEIDISGMVPGDTEYFNPLFPLYDSDTGDGYELQADEYRFVVALDPENQLEETDETNNESESSPFDYRIFSGDIHFGPALAALESAQITYAEAACPGEPYIVSGSGSWAHSWGTDSLSYAALCTSESVSGDGYSRDLYVNGGSASIPSPLQRVVAGLTVSVSGVGLGPAGMTCSSVRVDLPADVSVHERSGANGRVGPIGSDHLTFPGPGPVGDPSEIWVENPTSVYIHSYGLPFYIYAQDGVAMSLASDAEGVTIQNAHPYYVHTDSRNFLRQGDVRKSAGLPSNDALFVAGESAGVYVDGGGLQGECNFRESSSLAGSSRTAFPFGTLEWGEFSVSIQSGSMLETTVGDLAFTMPFSGACPACPGPVKPPEVDMGVGPATAAVATDGAIGMRGSGLDHETMWGQMETQYSGPTYLRDDTSGQVIFYLPGVIATGTASGHSLSAYLLGSRAFDDVDSLGVVHYLNESEAKGGNGYYAGLNVGPEILEPSVAAGVGENLAATPLSVLFAGNSSRTDFSVTERTKYLIRLAGLTGVFNTDFSGTLTVYGYDLQLERFAFRQVLNLFDDETLVDGQVSLPNPAGLLVYFNSLNLTCTGNFTEGRVDNETSCDGSDNDSDNRVDEGCYQALSYWDVPIKYLGMGFADPNGRTCPSGNQKLRLVTANQVNGISKPVTLTSFWEPEGTPLKDRMTGPAQLVMDASFDGKKKGFAVQVQDGYINRPFDTSGNGSPNWDEPQEPGSGFTNLITRMDLPLFNSPVVQAYLDNDAVDGNGQVAKDKYAIYLGKDVSSGDKNKNGVPEDLESQTTYMTDYWDMLDATETNPNPDQRVHVGYDWPNSASIKLNYPLRYQRATNQKGPQFFGIKQETKLPDTDPTILKVYSVPNYINPDRTKLSFGAGADLANLHMKLAAAGVNSLFSELNIDLTIDLDDLFDYRQALLDTVGADLSPLVGTALDGILSVGSVSGSIDNLAKALKTLHGIPAEVAGKIQNPILASKQKALKVLNDRKDAAGATVSDGLSKKLKMLYNDDDLLALAMYEPKNPPADMPGDLNTEKGTLKEITADLAELVKIVKAGRKAVIAAGPKGSDVTGTLKKELKESDSAKKDALDAIDAINSDLADLEANFDANPQNNQVLTGLNDALKALKDVKEALKDLNKVQTELTKVNGKIRDVLGGEISVASVMQVITWLKDKLPHIEKLISTAEQLYQDALNSAEFDKIFDDAQQMLNSTLTAHINGLSARLTTNILDETEDALTMADTGLRELETSLDGLRKLLTGQTYRSGASTWAQIAADARSQLNTYAANTLDNFKKVKLLNTASGKNSLNQEAEKLTNKATAAFLSYAGGLAALVAAPLRDANAKFATSLTAENQQLGLLLPGAKKADIQALIRNITLNSSTVREINKTFFAQFDHISDALDELVQGLCQHFNGMINQLIAAASQALSKQLEAVTSAVGVGGEGGIAAAKIDGYAIVSQDEVERFHLEAEMRYDMDPEPITLHAGMDISRWRPVNGRPSECCTKPGGGDFNGLIDAAVFANNVPVKFGGGKLKIKKLLIGFVLDEDVPKGTFGEINFKGGKKLEGIELKDLGAVAGLTWGDINTPIQENYIGGKCNAKFSGGALDNLKFKAAFFLGESCGLKVLKGLDKDVSTYIGKQRTQIRGFYTRASARMPVYNVGCALSIGVGADFGLWCFADPPPMYGGLFGGSVYGKVLCVGSVKGAMWMSGSKTAEQFRWAGSGWGAAGLGACDPAGWKTVEDSRSDGWCATWDATFQSVLSDNMSVTNVNTSGSH